MSIDEEVSQLERKAAQERSPILYATLTPWQKTQVARHPAPPAFSPTTQRHCSREFMPLAGDRNFGDDPAIVGGLGALSAASR